MRKFAAFTFMDFLALATAATASLNGDYWWAVGFAALGATGIALSLMLARLTK